MTGALPQRRSAPPVHRPLGYVAPYDGFEPRFRPGNEHVKFALIGLENRGGDDRSVRERLVATFVGNHAPEVLEHGRIRNGFGPPAQVWFAYWRTENAYLSWAARDDVVSLWSDEALLEGPIGLWREAGIISHDHNETSSSRPENLTGLVHFSDEMAITEIHGYWGSARDRIVAAADDSLNSTYAAPINVQSAIGRRLRVMAQPNLCFIRTSQDITGTTPEQLTTYMHDVEPKLMAGVAYLRNNGAEAGCLGIRFVEECDEAGNLLGRTCGAGYFESLADLERWTHTHHTHSAIMESFLCMVGRFAGNPGLNLWHEVTVFPEHHIVADYINCSLDGSLAQRRAAKEFS